MSGINAVENELFKEDFWFAAYLRELRLKNPFNEEMKQHYWNLFTMNIAILTILVQFIDKISQKHNFEYIGFCGRDTYYLYQIYKKFKQGQNKDEVVAEYLYYSRRLVDDCEEDMVKYFSGRMKNRKALMIDLTGTGMHLSKLNASIKDECFIMMCFWSGIENAYKMYPNMQLSKNWISIRKDLESSTSETKNFYIMGPGEEMVILSDSLELFNRATHNSPVKLKTIQIADKFIPDVTFSEMNDTEYLELFELEMKEFLNSKVEWIQIDDFTKVMSILKVLLVNFHNYGKKIILRNKHVINNN